MIYRDFMKDEERKQSKIGRYVIIERVGFGGMGEIFLAYDPICKRKIALKSIKPSLQNNRQIKKCFLREATIASQLNHPSIVSIYSINENSDGHCYYTMPYIRGKTLKDVLHESQEQDIHAEPTKTSVESLLHIFLTICEAIAYSHSKNILHRDLKLENIIIGTYGEVIILDWGIADFAIANSAYPTTPPKELPKKVAGTISYLAPEIALGFPASIQTDIYSLGVILYQMLTLKLPFQRGNLQAFRKNIMKEKIVDPIDVAPYRSIPHELSQVICKVLASQKSARYGSVSQLIADIKKIIDGKSKWTFVASIHPNNKEDWEYNEYIPLSKHAAITRQVETIQWVTLMVSKLTFCGNIRMKIEFNIQPNGKGFGILFGIPEIEYKANLVKGYCVWFKNREKIVIRKANIVVASANVNIQPDVEHEVIIETTNDHIGIFLNHELVLSYTSLFPLTGTHMGIIQKDSFFTIHSWGIYTSGSNVMMHCLAIPDAFFARGYYESALTEYRHIGRSFKGRIEGYQALFKAGLSSLKIAQQCDDPEVKPTLLQNASAEFAQLYNSHGAPFEYMGKALVCQEQGDYEEESKYLEFALRKFPDHPLTENIRNHILYRMHESASIDREATYRLLLLVLNKIPDALHNEDVLSLMNNVTNNWEALYVVGDHSYSNIILLAFWVNKQGLLAEIIEQVAQTELFTDVIMDALLSLLLLGNKNIVEEYIGLLPDNHIKYIKTIMQPKVDLELFFTDNPLSQRHFINCVTYIASNLLIDEDYLALNSLCKRIEEMGFDSEDILNMNAIFGWGYLICHDFENFEKIINSYPRDYTQDEKRPLYALYGTYIYMTKGEVAALNHWGYILNTPYPTSNALLGLFLKKKNK